MKILLILIPVCVFASNSVTLTELTGSAQTSRPTTISRVFAQGEIANFPAPQIGGTTLSNWQADVKNTWPDGSVKHALISFPQTFSANASVTITFVNSTNACNLGNLTTCQAAALTQTQMLAFNPGTGSSTWGGDIEATAASATQTANVRTMMAAGYWRYWLQGPVVTMAIVEDRSATRTYDFGWQCTSACTGSYTSVVWSQASSGSIYQSLHPIFTATFYAGWNGVQLDYILEDPWTDRLQDQAYSLALNAHYDLSVSKFTQSTLWHGSATRWRRRYWDGTTPGRIKTNLNFPYLISSKSLLNWDQTLVIGTSAVGLEVTEFQSAMPNSATFLTDDPNNLLALYSTGEYLGDMETTGGRPELGPLTRWDGRWFYTMDEGMWRVVIGNANSMGGIPIHVREARTDNYFYDTAVQPTPTTKAEGHFISIDGRPAGYFVNISQGGIDAITPVGTIRCSNTTAAFNTLCNDSIAPDASTPLWTPAISHFGATPYAAYLATGDWYFSEELYADAQFDLYYQGTGSTNIGRNGSTGYINNYVSDLRGAAWPIRAVGMAGWIGPSVDAEPLYLQEKTNRNIAVREGNYAITTGIYNGNADWTWGNTIQRGWNTYSGASPSNPLNVPYFHSNAGPINGSTQGGMYNAGAVNWENSPWQIGYYQMSFGWLQAEGYADANVLLAAQSIYFIDLMQAPGTPGYGYNPWIVPLYTVPALDINNAWYQSGTSMLTAWAPGNPWASVNSWTANSIIYNQVLPDDIDDGYNWIFRTAVALAAPYNDPSTGLTGAGSWNWLSATNATWVAGQGSNTANCTATYGSNALDDCDNPKWGLSPLLLSGSTTGTVVFGATIAGGVVH